MNKIRLRSLPVFILSVVLPVVLSLKTLGMLEAEHPSSFLFSPVIWQISMLLGGVSALFLTLGNRPKDAPIKLRIIGIIIAASVVVILFLGQEWTQKQFAQQGYLIDSRQPGLYQQFK